MKPKNLASIHTAIIIQQTEPVSGDVTLDEQVKAVQRFIRWHERQSRVGKELLAKLVSQMPKAAA